MMTSLPSLLLVFLPPFWGLPIMFWPSVILLSLPNILAVSGNVLLPHSCACPDSGATLDMFPDCSCFTDYTPLINCFVRVATNEHTPVSGRGTVSICLNTHHVRFTQCLHVPALDMPLLFICVHRRRGQGCTFLADSSGCFLTFPTFVLAADDTADCLLDYAPAPTSTVFDYDDTALVNSPLSASSTLPTC